MNNKFLEDALNEFVEETVQEIKDEQNEQNDQITTIPIQDNLSVLYKDMKNTKKPVVKTRPTWGRIVKSKPPVNVNNNMKTRKTDQIITKESESEDFLDSLIKNRGYDT